MLEDEDDANASIALRELLNVQDLDAIIVAHQDDANPVVCKRIHQLVSLRNHRLLMEEFPRRINACEYTNWEALAAINVILDPQTSLQQLDDMLLKLLEDDLTPMSSTAEYCDAIRELNFTVDETSDNFIVKYLLFDAMITFNADPLVIAVICQQIGNLCKWETTLGRLDGKICLRDKWNNICSLSPDSSNVKVNPLGFKPVSVRDIAIEVIGKIHSASCIDLVSSVYLDTRTLLEKIQS